MFRMGAVAGVLALLCACQQERVDGVGAEIERQEAEVASARADAQALVDGCIARNAQDQGVMITPSGLRYIILNPGDAAAPKPRPVDIVQVRYAGALMDGKMFDTSYGRDEPVKFPLNGVIAGWTEGLQLVHPGAEVCLIIPPDIAYGARGAPPDIPPEATLAFHIRFDGMRQIQGSNPVFGTFAAD